MKPPLTHEEVHLRDYIYVLRKRRRFIIFFAFLVFAAGIFYTFHEKVVYRAGATIVIEKENPNVVDFKEVMSFDASTTDYYQTQYQKLKSRSLVEELIESENLENDPYLSGARQGKAKLLLIMASRKYPEFFPSWFGGFLVKPKLSGIFIKNMLKIEPVRNSRLVKVIVMHPSSSRAAQLANRLVELFIERNLKERFALSERATQLLSNQLIDLKARVSGAERNLQLYKEQHGLINIPSIREKDKFVQDAKLELVKMQTEEVSLSKRYLPAHPKMISIRSQVEGLAEQIRKEEQKQLGLSRVAIEYSELERELETSRRIYESLLERFEETQSEAQTQASNVTIVDWAIPPSRPFKPRPLINVLASLFVGIVGGIFLAFFIEYLDPTVRIPDDIEKALGLDVIGIIPKVVRSWRKGPARGELFVTDTKQSAASESFRSMRTAMLFKLRNVTGCRVLLVTSANPSEGKSTVSINMSAAFEQNNLRVLLIDADLRKPRLHKAFGVASTGGLTDVLQGETTFRKAVHANVEELGFDFLSCGTHSEKPTELLGSDQMAKALNLMKRSYDIILIDSPPFLAVADVAVLNEYVDLMMVVAKYQKTHRRHLKNVKKNFAEGSGKMVGVVINQVSVREKDYYYNQYYYYGYGDSRGKK